MKTEKYENIWYLGDEMKCQLEVDSIDEAQVWLDYARAKGTKACATHKNGSHQIFIKYVRC